jgi:hypothetical protein
MSVVNGRPEFSFQLIPKRGEKMETFIKYGNDLERKEWKIQNGWGWILSAARFFKRERESLFLAPLLLWAGTT